MDATPISFDTAVPLGGAGAVSGAAGQRRAASRDIARRWLTLHAAAATVAVLAGVAVQTAAPDVERFPETVGNLPAWRQDFAAQGIDDIAAVMEPGLAALLAVHAGGADPAPAARALWAEFCTARDAVMRLASVPPASDERAGVT